MDLKQEKEICSVCNIQTMHEVEYTKMANGAPWRKGHCLNCGTRRPLPLNTKSPGEYQLYFGKHKGAMLKHIPRDYLIWALANVDLNHATKSRIETVLIGVDI